MPSCLSCLGQRHPLACNASRPAPGASSARCFRPMSGVFPDRFPACLPSDVRCAFRPAPVAGSVMCPFRIPASGVLCVPYPVFARPSAWGAACVRIRSFSVPPTGVLTAPCTLYPVPCTPHPVPSTFHPAPRAPSPGLRAPGSMPRIPHPAPRIPHPAPRTRVPRAPYPVPGARARCRDCGCCRCPPVFPPEKNEGADNSAPPSHNYEFELFT